MQKVNQEKPTKDYHDINLWEEQPKPEYDPIFFEYYSQQFSVAKNMKQFLRDYCGVNVKRLEEVNIPHYTYIFDLISKLEIFISENDHLKFHNLKWDLIIYMEKTCKVINELNVIKYGEINSRLKVIEEFIESYPQFLNSFELDIKYTKNLYETLKEYHKYIKQKEANSGPVKTYSNYKTKRD
jgi:hypothetical protein